MDGDASFGHWLMLRRKALRLSCVELARRVGCATVTLRKIEADERRPSEQIAAKLAEQLNVAPHERLTFIKVARGELGVHRLALPDQIANRPALGPGAPLRTQVPIPPSPLIGRAADVAAVRQMLLRSDVRLLTLTGAPGIGKTRVALQVARELQDALSTGSAQAFAHGVYLIPLASIRDPELVIPTIVQALAIREVPGQTLLECLQTYLRDRDMLLVLDNVEQVLKVAPQLGELLAAAPWLRLLITSRVVLHLSGEQRFAVPPLALPDVRRLSLAADLASTLADYAAVELFVVRARAAMPSFAMTDTNALAVAEICQRLDGLPLAIELAAARIALFTPPELLERLDGRLTLLTTGAVDLPTRQQTLRRALAWSYDLLDEREQRLFRRLGAFVGGCTLDAAEAVCSKLRIENEELINHPSEFSILDGLAALIDKSLLQRTEGNDGRARFTMLETIREYALERLAERGEADAIGQQHATYFLKFAEQYDPWPRLHAPPQQHWLVRVDAELDNLRAASRWFAEQGDAECGVRLAGALAVFWADHFHWEEGRAQLEAALTRGGTVSVATRAKAVLVTAWLDIRLGDLITARQSAEQSLALFRDLSDKAASAFALLLLGGIVQSTGEYAMAQACAEECLALFHEVSDHWGRALALQLLGHIAVAQGDVAQAAVYNEENLTYFRQIGDKRGIAEFLIEKGYLAWIQGEWEQVLACNAESLVIFRELGAKDMTALVLSNLGDAVLHQGEWEQAAACFAEGLALSQEIGAPSIIAMNLAGMADVAATRGQPERSARLLGSAEALLEAIGKVLDPANRDDYNRMRTAIRGQLDEATFAAAWAEGRTLTLEQAIAEALRAPLEIQPAEPAAATADHAAQPSPAPADI